MLPYCVWVCLVRWDYLNIWQGKVKKDCKKKKKKEEEEKKQVTLLLESHWTDLRLYGKVLYKNWCKYWMTLYTQWDYCNTRRSNTSRKCLLPKANKPLYGLVSILCQFLMKNLSLIIPCVRVRRDVCWGSWLSKTFKARVEGCACLMMLFYSRGFMFWSVRYNIIQGQFGFGRY